MLQCVLAQIPEATSMAEQGLPGGRTLFWLVLTALGLLGLSAAGLTYVRKHHLQRTVEELFRSFRAQAVSLMDELDALRKRHKTLPETDPDFKVPMTGATLARYEQVSRELDGLWERWLKIMEIWDQTQRHIRAGSALVSKPTEEARKLLEGDEIKELLRQSERCKVQLDLLNQGHETARADVATLRADLAAIQHQLTRGTGVLLPSDPHHHEIQQAETMLSEAELMLDADPIGAMERVAQADRMLGMLSHQPDRGTVRSSRSLSEHPIFTELAAAAERLRAAASRLRITDLIGLALKSWVGLCILGLVVSVLLPLLMPLLFLAFLFVFTASVWYFWRVMASWMVFGRGR